MAKRAADKPAVSTKRPSLIDIAKDAAKSADKHRFWLDKVEPEQREEILFVCREIVAGRITGSQAAIARAWAAAGIPITKTGIAELLAKVRSGAVK